MKTLIAMGCVLFLAGCASPAQKDSAETRKTETAQAQTEPPRCLQETGSHVRRSEERRCMSGPGQVYTREDIDRTGATTTGEALRKLSP